MNARAKVLLGADIGGTKCAASVGVADGGRITVLGRKSFATATTREPRATLAALAADMNSLLHEQGKKISDVEAIGISCGGPLDSARGMIMSPPNLPGWDDVPATQIMSDLAGRPAYLENDANACALAEWRWGAGQCRHMIFLTFGTGMGGGIILNNQLYRGVCDLAGEVGHMHLRDGGPIGYGKAGSFEGCCGGSGIARAAQMAGLSHIQNAHEVFENAQKGDIDCLKLVEQVARDLGRGLAILVDLFNPEKIVIGSIFVRQEKVLRPIMEEGLKKQALPVAVAACRIVPAALGESLGDYAALAVAQNGSAQ